MQAETRLMAVRSFWRWLSGFWTDRRLHEG